MRKGLKDITFHFHIPPIHLLKIIRIFVKIIISRKNLHCVTNSRYYCIRWKKSPDQNLQSLVHRPFLP